MAKTRGGGNSAGQAGSMAMSPEIWQQIFDNFPDPVFLHDQEYRLLMANRAYFKIAGVSEAEALGKPYWEVFPRGAGPLPGCRRTTAEEGSAASNGDVVQLADRTFLSLGYMAKDNQGALLCFMHIVRDITEQKKVMGALAESEAHLLAATECARDAIITLEGEGGTITTWNRAAEAIFGYSKEEMIGRALHDILVPPRFREAARAGMAHFATTGEGAAVGKTLELVALHKNGAEFPIELSLSAMQLNGKWYATGIARDITERKQAEECLTRLNRMYRTVSRCNEAMVRAQDELSLCMEMCRVLVEEGGFRAARVGYAETDPARRIRSVAAAGIAQVEIEKMNLAWGDGERSQGPAGIAVRTGKVMVTQDICNDPTWSSWHEQAGRLGLAAAAVFPLQVGGKVIGVFDIYGAEAGAFAPGMLEHLAELADDLAFGIGNHRSRAERMGILEKLELSLDHAVTAIAATVEMRDPYTAGHQRRVALLAVAIAQEMGLDEGRVEGLRMAGVVHDIGKIHVPAEILANPGKLSEAEFEIVKTHSQAGYEILKGIDFPWPVAEIVWQHHEKLDGSGYPRGLKGEEILLEARILTVADVIEAMASHRPYRPGLGVFPSLQEISCNKGRLYDERVVEACLRLFMEKGFEL